jgi:hypothetical protein
MGEKDSSKIGKTWGKTVFGNEWSKTSSLLPLLVSPDSVYIGREYTLTDNDDLQSQYVLYREHEMLLVGQPTLRP